MQAEAGRDAVIGIPAGRSSARRTQLSSLLAKRGFRAADPFAPASSGRYQIEVQPYAALPLKQRTGKLAARAVEFELTRLARLTPRLDISEFPPVRDLDALLAAYAAAHWWYWGRRTKQPAALLESDLHPDPIAQFEAWFAMAHATGMRDPHAMTLATVASNGQPSARMVLLKEAGADGFVFYTNYRSKKAQELDGNPSAALVFYWPELGRQVRVTGQVAKTSRAESEAYFRTRPHGAQIGAWASWQSSVIPDREALDAKVRGFETRFAGKTIPPPSIWGGYRLKPDAIEFWQSRPSRLHDRLRYTREPGGRWRIERLAP